MNVLKNINIGHSTQLDSSITTTVIIVYPKHNIKTLVNKYVKISSKYDDLLNEISKKFDNNPKLESLITVSRQDNLKKFDNIILLGINNVVNTNLLDSFRIAGYIIYKGMIKNQVDSINLIFEDKYQYLDSLLEGLLLSSYQFNKYKTDARLNSTLDIDFNIKNINIVNRIKNYSRYQKDISNLLIRTKCIFMNRDLVNLPPNDLNAKTFPKIIKNILSKNSIKSITLETISSTKLKKLGMNLLLAVGRASKGNTANLTILKYEPLKKKNPDLILLGKGVTYDSGGINLKSGRGLKDAKYDMAGASTVISTLIGLAEMKIKKNIIVYCPIVENNIDSSSLKVGEVIKAHNGSTVEIDNTDAEGRLIMADCLSDIVQKYPNSPIIDIATLTQQQEDLSCRMFTTLQGKNNSDISNKLKKYGYLINENIVEIPINYKLKSKLESKIADIKNSSISCKADLMISSLFLNHFINDTTNWTHLDIAGSSLLDEKSNINGESSGVGTNLLIQTILSM